MRDVHVPAVARLHARILVVETTEPARFADAVCSWRSLPEVKVVAQTGGWLAGEQGNACIVGLWHDDRPSSEILASLADDVAALLDGTTFALRTSTLCRSSTRDQGTARDMFDALADCVLVRIMRVRVLDVLRRSRAGEVMLMPVLAGSRRDARFMGSLFGESIADPANADLVEIAALSDSCALDDDPVDALVQQLVVEPAWRMRRR